MEQTGFQPQITIKDAITNIASNHYLLPAIQRKFVWSAPKVEMLFDSIMRGYPINSFMFWHITDNEIKKNFKFYQFLREYRERFKVDNPDIDTIGDKDFYAIIDGQQRLTSLYIGLKGTYAYKMPRKWWDDTEEVLPTRKLYLNLLYTTPAIDSEQNCQYQFRFLTKSEYEHDNNLQSDSIFWFPVRDILGMQNVSAIISYAKNYNLPDDAINIMSLLYEKINKEKLINYYLETRQDIDSVLDIFIRTNSGGVPLSFSNLLMSITTANWDCKDGTDARKSLSDLVKTIYSIGKPGFMITEDFILKTCLVLFCPNIKFNIKNFDVNSVRQFADNWDRIRNSIIAVFKLLEIWGFNDSTLRAKNAVIPLIYYVYHRHIENDLLKKTWNPEDKVLMRKWLCIALLKGIFGGQTDSILTKLRNVIENRKNAEQFPLKEIIEDFKGQDRNFNFTDDFIENVLTTQKDDSICYSILALIYSHKDFENIRYHKDHLHPASSFKTANLIKLFGDKDRIPELYANPKYWNSIVNLQLLDGRLNESKNDTPLKDWLEKQNTDIIDAQLIPHVDYAFTNFGEFYNKRKEMLIECLTKATKV